MLYIQHRKACCPDSRCNRFFLVINNTGGDVNTSLFQLMHDHGCQRYQHLCQNIRYHDIITLIAYLILHFLISNDIADKKFKAVLRNSIGLFIFSDCVYRTDIQIGSDRFFCPEHKRKDSQDTAAGSYIQEHSILRNIFP